jgi:hypothetical protein
MSEQTRERAENVRAPLDLPKIRELAPSVHSRLVEANACVWETVDPVLLELARIRIGMLLDPDNDATTTSGIVSPEKLEALRSWEDSPALSGLERACLAVVDQFIFYVADIDDALIGGLLEYLDPGEVFCFVQALNFLDATERLRVSTARLFDSEVTR